MSDVNDGHIELDKYIINRANFYNILLAPCNNRWLLSSWKQLYIQQMRYRHTFVKLAQHEATFSHNYQKFIDAACERDIDTAIALCLEQYQDIIDFMEHIQSPHSL